MTYMLGLGQKMQHNWVILSQDMSLTLKICLRREDTSKDTDIIQCMEDMSKKSNYQQRMVIEEHHPWDVLRATVGLQSQLGVLGI